MKRYLHRLLTGVLCIFPTLAFANPACPVCTVAIVAALPIAQHLGVESSVVGLWAGALLTLLGYWLIRWFDKRGWNFRGRNTITILASVAMIGFVYLDSSVPYQPIDCQILRIDPILFGAILGMIIFVLIEKLYDWMKMKNGGHAHFPFEKVVLPIVALLLVSWWLNSCPFTIMPQSSQTIAPVTDTINETIVTE